MTPQDFLATVGAEVLATHHPYHWLIVGIKWFWAHLVLVVFALIVKAFSK